MILLLVEITKARDDESTSHGDLLVVGLSRTTVGRRKLGTERVQTPESRAWASSLSGE